jgi:hypothetical protein
MTEFILVNDAPTEIEDEQLPNYKDPGRILFYYELVSNERPEVEIIDYDRAAFWLIEGGFADMWVAENVYLELTGTYVIEGIVGHVWQSYEGEYDEDWEFKTCRRASPEEILSQALGD